MGAADIIEAAADLARALRAIGDFMDIFLTGINNPP
jgi:hypothetical protein